MQNYHKHTDYSNVLVADCVATYKDYIKRAKELGHKVISSVEHGYQSNYYVPYEQVIEANKSLKDKYDSGEISQYEYEKGLLKFVFGAEAYWVKDRHEKDRSNCHIILLAKNEEGRRDINEALADANIDGYYGQPRVDLELLKRINPENVMVTTACVAYWKNYDDIDDITLELYRHFKNNFFLEIQCHNTELQKKINKHILELHYKYGIDIIFGYDSHYIHENESVERDNYIATRRKGYSKNEDDEQGWYMDYPSEQTVRERLKIQGILSDAEIDRCIANTDLILAFEDLHFDKEIKLPSSDLFQTQEQKNETLRNLVYSKWNEIKNTVPKERHQEYLDGINYELQAIIDTGMADYFLIDYKIVKKGIEKGGIITKTGRGSGVSYYVNSLLGFSDIDRFASPVKLYPDRFMSKTRILQTRSLPDLDLNLGNPEVFAEAQDEVLTEIYGSPNHSYPMISYKPLQSSSAFKLYAKSQNLDFSIANEITGQIAKYEKDLKHAETPEDKEAINIYDYVDKKYHQYLDESKKYRGIINAKSQAPCGYLIYGGNIKREIGLIRCVPENKDAEDSIITTVIDGMIAENYKFVKNDLLKVDIWLTVNKIFEAIGEDTLSVTEITKAVDGDKATWSIYENGYTMGVNQCESDFAKNACTRYKPQNMQELTALVAALRPGFKTQLENFLERKPYSTGVKELDDLLEDSFHYIMYQENIMTYLGWLGIEQTETYAIIKKISKKKFKEKELKELKDKLIKSWAGHTGTEDGFEKTWSIMEAFSKYAFNASHAYSYAYDSVYCAYLKAHYPYEFYSVMMEHLTRKGDKDKVTEYKAEMQKAFKINISEYKFRDDNRKFTANKDRKCISPALSSIKGFSDSIAETLYSLKDNEYENFSDLLTDLKQNGLSDKIISTLININYFTEFGNIKFLEKYFEIFNIFYGNKSYKSQIKKDKVLELELDFDIIKANCGKDTPKTFIDIDAKSIISQIMDKYKDIKTSEKEIIQRRFNELGYLDIVDKKYTGFCFCMDVDTKYSPKLKLYALANGGVIPVKISKKDYNKNPISQGDIIKVVSQYKKPKMFKDGDKWTESSEKEWWISEYQII